MTSLAEVVDYVIGVDTHVDTHTAAVIDAHTGAALADLTVPTTPEGYQALVDFADEHGPGGMVGPKVEPTPLSLIFDVLRPDPPGRAGSAPHPLELPAQERAAQAPSARRAPAHR